MKKASKEVYCLPANYTIPDENKEKILEMLTHRFEYHTRQMEKKRKTGEYSLKYFKELNL